MKRRMERRNSRMPPGFILVVTRTEVSKFIFSQKLKYDSLIRLHSDASIRLLLIGHFTIEA